MRDLKRILSGIKVAAAISGVLLSPLMAGDAMATHCAGSNPPVPCDIRLNCDDGSTCVCDVSADCNPLGQNLTCDSFTGFCAEKVYVLQPDDNLDLLTDPTALVR
jgi:hypothetical protein